MTWWASFKKDLMSPPNALSVLRGILGFIIPFMLCAQNPWIHIAAALLFVFASVTDYWDGWLARKQGLVSDLGKILDPTSDKILVLGTFLAFAVMGVFSPWWLVAIFFREIVITFCRMGWMLEKKAAGAEKLGKIKLVIQVVTLLFPLFELLARDFAILQPYAPIAYFLTIVFLVLTNILTVVSGLTFAKSNRELFKSPMFAKYTSAAGVGLIPGTPGTWGSLLALTIIPLVSWDYVLYGCIAAFLLWASHWSIKRLDLTVVKDPQFVVMDEVIGIFVTFIAVKITWGSILLGFFLFRFFDIAKPFPCRSLEKCRGFWGIMLDDVAAGIYSCVILHLIYR